MVVRCKICNAYSVFHAWIGVKSRVTMGCKCKNSVWIYPDEGRENIRAEDMESIEIWHAPNEEWINYANYTKLYDKKAC